MDNNNSSSSEDENDYPIISDLTESDDDDTDEETQTTSVVYHDNINHVNIWEKIFQREQHHNFQIQCNQLPSPHRVKIWLRDIIPFRQAASHIFMGLSVCKQFMLSYTIRPMETNAAYSSFSLRYTLYFWRFHINNPQQKMCVYHQRALFDDHGINGPLKVTMTQWKRNVSHVLVIHGAADLDYEDSYITYVKVPKIGCADCRQQQRLRESESENAFQNNALCLKCNMTAHIKYSKTESDCDFSPYINLLCPDRMLIVSNGIMHMLSIDIESPPTPATILAQCSSPIVSSQTSQNSSSQQMAAMTKAFSAPGTPSSADATATSSPAPSTASCSLRQANELETDYDSHKSFTCHSNSSKSHENNKIVASILADFSDIETDAVPQSTASMINSKSTAPGSKASICSTTSVANVINTSKGKIVNCTLNDELVFNCVSKSGPSHGMTSDYVSSSEATTSFAALNKELKQAEKQPHDDRDANENASSTTAAGPSSTGSNISSLSQYRAKRQQRIVTKSYRYGVITVDMQGAISTTTCVTNNNANNSGNKNDKSNAYEFSEETEKCEKISTLRKRRLAEKKYEFSEDNSENIIPFTKVRLANKGSSQPSNNSPSSTGGDSIHNIHHGPVSPASLPPPSSPCASPVGVMHSPSRYQFMSPHLSSATQHMLSFKPLGTLSPIQLSSMSKRSYFDGSMSPNSSAPFLSPRRDYPMTDVVPLHVSSMPEKPVCTKKFKRRYVEEDDAASVITSEEDDCISPGYHTLLPCDVHGSSYSEMQMISKASYQQIRCASVVVTQHSFDLETFTYYALNTICKKNNKVYDVIADWACEPIYLCPVSSSVVGLLIAQFYAHDADASKTNRCATCVREMFCIFHRHQCESRILFTWNMESGECEVIDYGEMTEKKQFQNSSKHIGLMSRGTDLAIIARKAAADLKESLSKVQDYRSNLRVLDSNTKRSKKAIIEEDHGVEFHLSRPRALHE